MSVSKVIREYRLGDEVAINRGFNEVFHVERSLNEWAWKFPASGAGRAITLAEREGKIQAHFAGLPLRYQIDNDVFDIFSVVDVYARATARSGLARRADMEKTVEAFFEIYSQRGQHPFVLGFPSPRHRRLGIMRFGYESVSPHPVSVVQRSSVARRDRLRRLFYRAELAPDWEPRLDTLWQRVKHSYPAAMVRDTEYALRRFAGHPNNTYHRFLIFPRFSDRPVAWVVFRIENGCCWWADLLWDHEHVGALDLVAALSRRLCAQTGVSEEGLWLEGDRRGLKALIGLGFVVKPEPSGLSLVIRRIDPEFDPELLANRAYITMADVDLI